MKLLLFDFYRTVIIGNRKYAKERAQSQTGIYHVMLRGINRQDIFDEPEDYSAFIRALSSIQYRLEDGLVTKVCTCHIYAYCLMPNHVHLLLCEKNWKVGEVIKSIAASYVLYYNKKYGRTGHLFQDRFKSEPCNDASYFITLFRYIFLLFAKINQEVPKSSEMAIFSF